MTSLLHHYWWRGLDSNQCRRKPTDLQSAPFSHSGTDRKSTRLNSSHTVISYAVFCLKKKNHRYGHPLPRENLYAGLLQPTCTVKQRRFSRKRQPVRITSVSGILWVQTCLKYRYVRHC